MNRYKFRELFNAMRSEPYVMAEHGDDEGSLIWELISCDVEIYEEYLRFHGLI